MASSSLFFLFLLFFVSATARPCKTIFFITSSSNSPRLTFLVTEIRRTRSLPRPLFFDGSMESSSSSDDGDGDGYYSSVKTWIGERSMDMMSIVGALLFGVGCGALTAATMYLLWSVLAPRPLDLADEEENEVKGYVAVKPTPPPPAMK